MMGLAFYQMQCGWNLIKAALINFTPEEKLKAIADACGAQNG
jgi:hypothetical protein